MAAVLIALPLLGSAATDQDNCDVVYKAAAAGRDQAAKRISDAEEAVRAAAERQRTCLEQFADIAARQSIAIGGFDAGALRKFLGDKACNMIDSQVAKTGLSASQLKDLQTAGQQAISNGTLPASSVPTSVVPASTQTQVRSIWSRMSCSMTGNC